MHRSTAGVLLARTRPSLHRLASERAEGGQLQQLVAGESTLFCERLGRLWDSDLVVRAEFPFSFEPKAQGDGSCGPLWQVLIWTLQSPALGAGAVF